MKKIFFIILYLIILLSLCFAQNADGFDFNGIWAANDGDYSLKNGGFFISIEKMYSQNKYFIISINTDIPIFTFIGGGFVREDGFLQIKTSEGVDWLITPAFSTKHGDAISITNLENIDSFGSFVRSKRKYVEWPFEFSEDMK